MKKVVCLQNVYFEGRFISAGISVDLPDDVACNWVKRGLSKFVGEETPVNPPAVPPVEKPDENSDLPPEVTPEGKGVVKFENDETPVSPNENSTTTPATATEENAVVKQDFTTENEKVEETPVADDDRPKRGRPPKKNGGKRR